jgi:hypothetical protein
MYSKSGFTTNSKPIVKILKMLLKNGNVLFWKSKFPLQLGCQGGELNRSTIGERKENCVLYVITRQYPTSENAETCCIRLLWFVLRQTTIKVLLLGLILTIERSQGFISSTVPIATTKSLNWLCLTIHTLLTDILHLLTIYCGTKWVVENANAVYICSWFCQWTSILKIQPEENVR